MRSLGSHELLLVLFSYMVDTLVSWFDICCELHQFRTDRLVVLADLRLVNAYHLPAFYGVKNA
jgi:hypothetical protein